jgi:hypothetical protein
MAAARNGSVEKSAMNASNIQTAFQAHSAPSWQSASQSRVEDKQARARGRGGKLRYQQVDVAVQRQLQRRTARKLARKQRRWHAPVVATPSTTQADRRWLPQ